MLYLQLMSLADVGLVSPLRLRGSRAGQLTLLVKQELIGVAGILSKVVLGPHHQIIAVGLFPAREVRRHGSCHPPVDRKRLHLV